MSKMARVAVAGYGTVGKRVADAVNLQPDMELAGVVDVVPSDLVRMATTKGYRLFSASEDATPKLEAAGIPVAGSMTDLLAEVDVVVDCLPGGVTAKNLPFYVDSAAKFIVNGGETHDLTGFSFGAFANYRDALGRDAARVVSCNTTSQVRLLSILERSYGLEEVFLAITRRGVDPINVKGGPVNATIATLPGFSHHAPDIQTIIPGLNVRSMAVVVPTTLMHVHTVRVELASSPSVEDVRKVLGSSPRVRLVSGGDGTISTAHIIEWARDSGRPRNDHWEIAIWEDSLAIEGNVLHLLMAVHMESVIVPENVDCIRAMCELEVDPAKAIRTTDVALGFGMEESSYASLSDHVRPS